MYGRSSINELPIELKDRAVDVARRFITPERAHWIRSRYTENTSWMGEEHFGWGVELRNALREAGLTDDLLPSGNWDDFYVTVAELAAGIHTE